jgi:hypothetical protein
VGTRLKNGLVTKWSNPVKFYITNKGLELARRIVSIEMGEESVSESVNRRLEPESVGQKRKAKNASGQSGGRKEDNRKKRSKVKLSNDSL